MSLQTEILGLSIAYVVLGVLLLIAVTRARLPWPAKAAAIAATSAFYVFVFFRLEGFLGWPATAALPPRFELLWAQVVDRNLVSNEAGAIHLWVAELNDANLPSRTPRAYVLPYSAQLAEKIEKARAEITKGHPQFAKPWDYAGGQGLDLAAPSLIGTVRTTAHFTDPQRPGRSAEPGQGPGDPLIPHYRETAASRCVGRSSGPDCG